MGFVWQSSGNSLVSGSRQAVVGQSPSSRLSSAIFFGTLNYINNSNRVTSRSVIFFVCYTDYTK